jgi:hypothetical protein
MYHIKACSRGITVTGFVRTNQRLSGRIESANGGYYYFPSNRSGPRVFIPRYLGFFCFSIGVPCWSPDGLFFTKNCQRLSLGTIPLRPFRSI